MTCKYNPQLAPDNLKGVAFQCPCCPVIVVGGVSHDVTGYYKRRYVKRELVEVKPEDVDESGWIKDEAMRNDDIFNLMHAAKYPHIKHEQGITVDQITEMNGCIILLGKYETSVGLIHDIMYVNETFYGLHWYKEDDIPVELVNMQDKVWRKI